MREKNIRIIYFGTPDFAVTPLDLLVNTGYSIVAVVTVPDKPAGRGQNLRQSAVKQFATAHELNILQPSNLKDPQFIDALKSFNADLQIVVAFRMLPDIIWQMPKLGTINLHASLLPQYRGAAPINRAIMNGEETTGLTTFFLQHEIDTGAIIFQEEIEIKENETAGELHDKMLPIGANLILKTVNAIANDTIEKKQQSGKEAQLKNAPKIFKKDCEINWQNNAEQVYNHIRGLSPYPAAFTTICSTKKGERRQLKIFEASKTNISIPAGSLKNDNKTFLYIGTKTTAINILSLQLEGKKRMDIDTFLRGFDISLFDSVK